MNYPKISGKIECESDQGSKEHSRCEEIVYLHAFTSEVDLVGERFVRKCAMRAQT